MQTVIPPYFGDYILIAALNPCPSGYHGSKNLMEYSHPIRTRLLLRMTSGERDF